MSKALPYTFKVVVKVDYYYKRLCPISSERIISSVCIRHPPIVPTFADVLSELSPEEPCGDSSSE